MGDSEQNEPQPNEPRLADYQVILTSLDPQEPMEGETPEVSAATLEEARTWVEIYREVAAMEATVLDAIVKQLPELGAAARREAETTDVPLINGQLQRFRWRLMQWERRLHELEN